MIKLLTESDHDGSSIFRTDRGSSVEVSYLVIDKYGDGSHGTYTRGLSVGDSFGLRTAWTHNTNVYGRISDISRDSIRIIHPSGSTYVVSTEDVSLSYKELRFKPKPSSDSWFGFIDLR